ncbi:glycosyl hydrolase family 3 N terminal domain-containing protein [Thozetella sp. PMI_491]|nr:glycosyl hydrolase family 3 N terminal domain-containing protein [Thozetella sp. PMI_491]
MASATEQQDAAAATWPYRDPKLPVEQRVEDLLGRMTIEEKAGLMFQDIIVMGPGGQLSTEYNPHFGVPPTDVQVGEKLMSHFNLLGPVHNVRETAEWSNRLQQRALETRLGIPVTLSTDPRHHFADNIGTGFNAGALSQWPETLGIAALQSTELVERFAQVAREEYLALGIRLALHPQVDLATEPRWSRIGRTFGEDAELSARLAGAYIAGFQGPELGPNSVSTMTKHFPGGGPQKDGEDPHFHYGKEQVYPGGNMEYHLIPFKAAIAAKTSQMMPYYGVPVGTKYEEVGFAFNKGIVTELLRGELGFTGIICTDWGLVTDAKIAGQDMPARAWGVEHLSEMERVLKIIEAGCDQLGGESRPELVVKLVREGRVPESRIDESVRRLLREKFVLGLFEQPFVDVDAAVKTVGKEEFMKAGMDAQQRAFTLLTNKNNTLPLPQSRRRVYLEGIDPAIAAGYGIQVVGKPEDAEVALLRLKAPHEARPGGFESKFHSGSLEFPAQEKARLATICTAVPTIVDVHLDRPAIMPELASSATALMVSYGSSSEAFLDVVLGKAAPEGRLPFDLPSSMSAVEASRSDVPYDTAEPAFRFGHGLRYAGNLSKE